MPLPRIVRVLASVRVPSSYGPDVEYEMVHAVIRPDPDSPATAETVILRFSGTEGMYRGGPAEILAQDLPAVHGQWTRFVFDVFARRAEAGDADAQAALERLQRPAVPGPAAPDAAPAAPVISASGGRFGPRAKAPAPPPPEPVPVISAGPKKAPARLPEADAPPTVPFEQAAFAPEKPGPAVPGIPEVPKDYQVIGFHLSTPPTAEGLLAHIAAHPHDLIVVAPAAVAAKAETYINEVKSGRVSGPPAAFSIVVVRHPENFSYKKLRAELASALLRMLGELNSAVWILPE